MDTQVIQQATSRSLQGTITFGEVVRDLLAIGVESYDADLVRMEKTYYMPNGETHIEKLGIKGPAISRDFSREAVVAALKAIQKQEINYVEFLNRILAAGTTRYIVFLTGRKAVYYGRKGEFHVEDFPDKA
ncbi:MAG: DUF1398 domain-containing protein [Candidatus Omnitrophota bacterium]